MYNRVSDNLEVDAEPCKSAAAVPGKAGTVRVTPAHPGYGTLDVTIAAAKQWVTFELGDVTSWTADPKVIRAIIAGIWVAFFQERQQ